MAKVWILLTFGFLNKSESLDLFRRSRATGLYQDGVPLEVVSTLLGHANTETTRLHYASPSVEQLREAMQKSSIKGNDEEPAWKGRETELKAMFGL